jgi:hypothetical protein
LPRVSEFYGVTIAMYFNDHQPAHFHAYYGEHEALVVIETLSIYAGSLLRRALALVLERGMLHRPDLRANWERARRGQSLTRIEPLD